MAPRFLSSPSERVGLGTAFLVHATVSGTWAPRLPAIKDALHLSAGMLGTALVGLAIGLVAGTRLAGGPVDRVGSRPLMRGGFPLLCGALVLPAVGGGSRGGRGGGGGRRARAGAGAAARAGWPALPPLLHFAVVGGLLAVASLW